MKTYTKRALSWMLAAALLITCGISGLVLPAAAEETNLFVNGDFEQGASVNWGDNARVQSGIGKDGSWGYYTQRAEGAGDWTASSGMYYKGALLSQLEASTEYTLSFDYKNVGGGRPQVYFVANWGTTDDGKALNNYGYDLPATEVDWTTYTITFTTPATISANKGWELNLRSRGAQGTTYYDNFKLVKKVAASTLTGITLDKTTASVEEGATVTLTATAVPEGADISALTWETADATVATVADGVVTGVKTGTTTVTAKVGEITATCEVTVVAPNLFVNGDFEQGASVNWGNNARVQSGIGKDGSWGYYTQRAASAGEWTASSGMYYKSRLFASMEPNAIYALSFDYKHVGGGVPQIYFGVTFGETADGKELSASKPLELPGTETEWTTYTVQVTTGSTVSSNTGWEINIRSRGAQGTTYYDNFKLVKVGEVAAPTLTGITLDKTTATLEVDGTVTLTATAVPEGADISALIWETSDATVATVENGVVTAKAAGTATITAKVGEITATCTVTVNAKSQRPQTPTDPNALIVNGDFEADAAIGWRGDTDIKAGVGKDGSWGAAWEYTHDGNGNKTFSIQYNGTNLKNLKPGTKYVLSFDYKSSGAGFAQLYNYLDFTADWARGTGVELADSADWTNYTFTFTTKETLPTSWGAAFYFRYIMYGNASGTGTGSAAFDNITLTEIPVATNIMLDKETATVKVGKTFTLAVSTEPATATLPDITWTTSDANVATVANGVVTGVAEGTATITATAGELTDTCVVTIVPDDGNLFENGDFEQGANVAWGGVSQVQAGVGKDGSYGVKIESLIDATTTGHKTPGFYYKEALISKLQPDTVYQLTFDYKHEGKGFGTIYLNKDFGTIEGSGKDFYKQQDQKSGDVDWTTVTYTFYTPSEALSASTSFEFLLRQVQYNVAGNEGTGATYYDNFKLVKVRDVVHADEIYLAPSELELLPYESGTLKVMTKPEGASTGIITYTSSDPSVATVDKNGKVTALVAEGEVTVTVTNDRGKSCEAKVKISDYADLIKNGDFEQGGDFWGNHVKIQSGIGKDGGWGLEAPDKDKAVYYKTSLSAVEPATTYILTFDYTLPKGADFRVWSAANGLNVTVIRLKSGDSEWNTSTTVFTTPANMTLSSGWDICFVSDEVGTETPAVIDNVSLRKYDSGVDADKLNLDKTSLTLIPGRTGALTLTAEPKDANLNGTVWTSSDENVATVEYGVVTGIGKGTATVTATDANGVSVSCTVTVSGDEVYVKNGTFDMENDESWTLTGDAAIAEGEGRVDTNAAKLPKDATITQTVTGLKPDTPYQLVLRSRTQSGALNITLASGETVLVEGKTGTSTAWSTTTLEFTTPADFSGDAVLTLAPAGNGPVFVDNVRLTVKASLIDFVVNDLFWVGGGYQVEPGTELQFGVTVTNVGEDPVKVGETLVVELRKNGEAFMTMEYEVTQQMGTNGNAIFLSDEKWAAEDGHWVISACANPTLSILETVDSNNTTQKNLRVDDEILTAPQVALDADMTDLTFSDEFDSLDSIDMYASGADGYKWYVTRQWAASTITPDCYSIEDGIITLHSTQPGYHVTLSSVDVNTQVGYTWNKGYLEARFRIPNADPGDDGVDYDGSPAIWSFPDNKWLETKGENHKWVEMDWLEYWGVTSDRPGGYYTVTYHDQHNQTEDQDAYWYSNSNAYQEGLGDEEWHTMGWLWVENAVITYVDGVEVQRITYGDDILPSSRLSMHDSVDLDATGAFTLMNDQFNVLFLSAGKNFEMEMDYVRIWQGGTGEIELPGEGEDEDTPAVDVDANSFWYYYCTDDYGDNIVEVTEDNYRIVLGGKELWEQLSEERKAEINAILAANGQPSFDELLAAALALESGADTPTEPEPIPGTGVATALPAMLAAALLSGAVLVTSRKRKASK